MTTVTLNKQSCGNNKTQRHLVVMNRWSAEHRAFVVESMLKNNESVVATQRAFRQHFNIHRNDSVPARNTIKLWIKNFR